MFFVQICEIVIYPPPPPPVTKSIAMTKVFIFYLTHKTEAFKIAINNTMSKTFREPFCISFNMLLINNMFSLLACKADKIRLSKFQFIQTYSNPTTYKHH